VSATFLDTKQFSFRVGIFRTAKYLHPHSYGDVSILIRTKDEKMPYLGITNLAATLYTVRLDYIAKAMLGKAWAVAESVFMGDSHSKINIF
jgi:hypothetical protein